ncbi:MAG: XTP/dITP diphosphatase [Candidatus Omnitrophota bacterium]|nr:XTP/dITP diphosphatase [Candidatus Omnitrophota bacterium]
MKELVVATTNKDKIKEIKKILKGLGVKVLTPDKFGTPPAIVEDGRTFEDNASKKARIISRFTGRLSIADDSGLMVDALGGRPGVRSSRFAGEKATYVGNNAKLLWLLKNVPPAKRKARFVCVIAIAKDGKVLKAVKGIASGNIAFEPSGKSGFGYDPLFIDPKYGRTFAELGPAIKNKISHRYRALEKAKKALKKLL